jgi:hypothetical protein
LGQQSQVVHVLAHLLQPQQQLEQQLEVELHWRFLQDWNYLDGVADSFDVDRLTSVTACDYL